jgi:hypothetical protein
MNLPESPTNTVGLIGSEMHSSSNAAEQQSAAIAATESYQPAVRRGRNGTLQFDIISDVNSNLYVHPLDRTATVVVNPVLFPNANFADRRQSDRNRSSGNLHLPAGQSLPESTPRTRNELETYAAREDQNSGRQTSGRSTTPPPHYPVRTIMEAVRKTNGQVEGLDIAPNRVPLVANWLLSVEETSDNWTRNRILRRYQREQGLVRPRELLASCTNEEQIETLTQHMEADDSNSRLVASLFAQRVSDTGEQLISLGFAYQRRLKRLSRSTRRPERNLAQCPM